MIPSMSSVGTIKGEGRGGSVLEKRGKAGGTGCRGYKTAGIGTFATSSESPFRWIGVFRDEIRAFTSVFEVVRCSSIAPKHFGARAFGSLAIHLCLIF